MRPTGKVLPQRKSWRACAFLFAALAAPANLWAAGSFQIFLNRLMQGKGGGHRLRSPDRPDSGPLEFTMRIQRSLRSRVDSEVSGKHRRPQGGHHLALGENPVPARPAASGRILSLLPSAGFPPFDLAGALANSCNYFFSELSTRLSSSALAHWFAVFGFGGAEMKLRPGRCAFRMNPGGKRSRRSASRV